MEEINKGLGVSHLVADDADGGRSRAITPKPAIPIHLAPKCWALRLEVRDSCLSHRTVETPSPGWRLTW